MAVSVVPAAGWMAAYERPWLKADVLAGLTTAAVVIPKAMAYAAIAGSLACTKHGAQPSFPSRAEIEARVNGQE